MKWLLVCVLAIMSFCFASPASAQSCTVTTSNVSFGVVRAISPTNTDANGTVQATCSGNASQTVKICVSIGPGSGGTTISPRTMLSGSNKLSFDIYSDSGYSVQWGSTSGGTSPPALFVPLPSTAGQAVTKSWPMYMRVPGNQRTVYPGTYQSNFGASDVAVYVGYDASSSCTGLTYTQNASFSVSANAIDYCNTRAEDLDFGTHGVINANVDSSTFIRITCTRGTAYSVSLDNGLNGSSPTTRQLASGSNRIGYQLYSDTARSRIAGSQTGQQLSGTGVGTEQWLYIYGRVPPQPTPLPGSYGDTVVYTISY